jgi:hypothetical protein
VTALAQGTAGLALVMCFGLLGARQVALASILLAIQGLAVAIAALAQHQPLIAAATAAIDVVGAVWFLRVASIGALRSPIEPPEGPMGGARLGVIVGAALAVLCQSSGPLALPLAVVLLSVLLAATRQHRLMQLIALVSLQNGVALAACLVVHVPFLALACFVLPLPLAAGFALGGPARYDLGIPRWMRSWLGWAQLAVSVAMFAASLAVRLDPLATIFAPLIGMWGIADAWAGRHRMAQSPARRLAASARLGLMLVAVGTTQPVLAWLAVTGAMTAPLFPALSRRWNEALLAFCASGLVIFGLLTMSGELASVSYTGLFVGYAAIAAVVPELGVVVVFLVMRLTVQTHLPSMATALLLAVASVGLLTCALLLLDNAGLVARGRLSGRTGRSANQTPQRHLTLLSLAQTSIIAVALGLDLPDARFAAVVLLILLILTRTAARIAHGAVAAAAAASLGGIPPLGVFPGLVLVLLALSSHAPWLLLPIGIGLAGVVASSIGQQGWWRDAALPSPSTWTSSALRSVGLVPLALALLFGFFAPDGMVDWLRAATAAAP